MQAILGRILRSPYLLLASLAFCTTACKTGVEKAESGLLESDADKAYKQGNVVPSTRVGNQGQANFCWSYSVVGMIESLHLDRTGKEVRLSPEFLGLHHLARSLKTAFEKAKVAEDLGGIASKLLDGNIETNRVFDTNDNTGVGTLLSSYGMMPESIYPVTFVPSPQYQDPAATYRVGLIERILELLKNKGLDYIRKMNEDMIIKELIVSKTGPGYTVPPPMGFTYEGKTYSAKSFLKEYLRFDPGAMIFKRYAGPGVYTPSNVEGVSTEKMIEEIDRNIKAGIPVPFAMQIIQENMERGTFYTDMRPGFTTTGPSYGHMMTFVGPTKDPVRASHPNDRLIVRNSWGSSPDPNGNIPSDGLYLMETGYMKKFGAMMLVAYMPKKAGQKPLLSEEASRGTLVCVGHKTCDNSGMGRLNDNELGCKKGSADWKGQNCPCRCSL